jgi:hypothetical protein
MRRDTGEGKILSGRINFGEKLSRKNAVPEL